ncbi:hypothetical protein C8Q80DRAFT_1169656 [Daedaleopsis nitida]|nr:hypothetical protein C8Q80DRAFT_1169656 [Daedaleopsis nitida]
MTTWLYNAAEAAFAYIKPPPRAHQNLQQYAGAAILPQMELAQDIIPTLPALHLRSHKNHLPIAFESHRVLENVHLRPDIQYQAVAFCRQNLPTTPRGQSDDDLEDGGQITIPAPDMGYHIPPRVIGKASDLRRVYEWVTQYPLETVRRMMQLAYPSASNYTFNESRRHDTKLMRCVTWGPTTEHALDARDMNKPALTVFVQTPWILTRKDMEAFVKCHKFPSRRTHFPGQPVRSEQRVWGKIYDVCSHTRSRWFVLTSYWGWVFGTFSEGMTQAWVSQIIDWDSKQPTVIEHLFFWFASATSHEQSLPCAWAIPQVPEVVQMDEELDLTVGQDEDVHMDLETVHMDMETEPSVGSDAPSISDGWTSRSDARSHSPSGNASVDGYEDDDAGTIMDGQAGRRSKRPTNYNHEATARWVQQPVIPRAPSPASSEASWVSDTTDSSMVSTVRDFGDDEEHSGAYMSGYTPRSSKGVERVEDLVAFLGQPWLAV